ncbi:uncharacterized protein LOC115956804 [Quercus lobata]|uniref:uncharacterized protein LOC115956804 n=1 Tax=Quercus lobata TaxID=97700 RepID=UPI0012476005|nr:uncharacterized protein LOC115956804 [Quercus lobata]
MTRLVGPAGKSVFTADSREQASIGQAWAKMQIKSKPSVGPTSLRQTGRRVMLCSSARIEEALSCTTEYFTKWVEAVPLRKATGGAVANFIKENIIVRFRVPHKIISDNGTPFVNSDVRRMLEFYQVKHHRSSPYYPQGNGQTEATNKVLIKIISMMSQEYAGGWMQEKEKEGEVFTAERFEDLKELDEKRKEAQERNRRYRQKMTEAYGRMTKERVFAEGQLVLKVADYVKRGLAGPSKFAPK